MLFNPALADFVAESRRQALDYLAVIPYLILGGSRNGNVLRGLRNRRWAGCVGSAGLPGRFRSSCMESGYRSAVPMCSIGQYLIQLARWRERYDCPGSASTCRSAASAQDTRPTRESRCLCPTTKRSWTCSIRGSRPPRRSSDARFWWKTTSRHFTFPDEDFSEPKFLNELTRTTGCSLLLDLHNVYTNARNHGFDAKTFLTELDLSCVVEIHVAGGSEMMGVYTDSTPAACAEEVWDLLSFVAPRSPNLRGVTFEFHESTWPLLRTGGGPHAVARARTALATPRAPDYVRAIFSGRCVT